MPLFAHSTAVSSFITQPFTGSQVNSWILNFQLAVSDVWFDVRDSMFETGKFLYYVSEYAVSDIRSRKFSCAPGLQTHVSLHSYSYALKVAYDLWVDLPII